jgi:hypothetical protein
LDALDILVRTLSTPTPRGSSRALWQYHSRSDRHSKVACWGVLFDLLQTSALLRSHVSSSKVSFGINHVMRDFVHNKEKALDLVLCRPEHGESRPRKGRPKTLATVRTRWGIDLTSAQQRKLETLPVIEEAPVGAVLVALEAKATMTEHGKAGPRLYDELNSSHQIVHASSNQALSVGFFMVNAAEEFISPDRNRGATAVDNPVVTIHRQPSAAENSIRVVKGLPRRSGISGVGYDGLAIVVVSLRNDGVTPATLVTGSPAPPRGDIFNYDSMLIRIANEYDAAFARI